MTKDTTDTEMDMSKDPAGVQSGNENVVQISEFQEEEKSNINQALTFKLCNEIFAMEVTRVEEILDNVNITRVPGADAFAPALINVRGNVVPLIDLRHRFGLPEVGETIDTRTVVFDVDIQGISTKVALKADSVNNVTDISDIDVSELPEVGTRWNRDFVKGITRQKDEVVIVLDIEQIFNSLDQFSTHQTGEKNETHN